MAGADDDPRNPTPKTKSRQRRQSRQDTPERRAQPGAAASSQHFDLAAALPPDMRPSNFIELEEQKFEIMQYLVNTQGLTGRQAQQVISNLEVDLMNSAR